MEVKSTEDVGTVFETALTASLNQVEDGNAVSIYDDRLRIYCDFLDSFLSVYLDFRDERTVTFEAHVSLYRPFAEHRTAIDAIDEIATELCLVAPGLTADAYENILKGGTIEGDDIIFKMEYDPDEETLKETQEWR